MATAKKTQTVKLSHQIWNRIKDIDLELFALPDQFVEVNATPVMDISDTELHLLLKADAVLPQLEEKLRGVRWDRKDPTKQLEVYQKSKFVVVKIASAE
jgi:hypothetical protein